MTVAPEPCPNPECGHPTVFVIESLDSAYCYSACGLRGPLVEYESAPPGTVDHVQWAVEEAHRLWNLLPRAPRWTVRDLSHAAQILNAGAHLDRVDWAVFEDTLVSDDGWSEGGAQLTLYHDDAMQKAAEILDDYERFVRDAGVFPIPQSAERSDRDA